MTSSRRVARRIASACLLGAALVALGTESAASVVCEPAEGHTQEAIQTGWPPDAPYEYVLVATIQHVRPLRGDPDTWGQMLEIRVEAVLRGDLPLSTSKLYNPPLGVYGWQPFRVGRQYLIAAGPSANGTPGEIFTSRCAPNEEITTRERFDELVGYSERPILADTALPTENSGTTLTGWLLVGVAAGIAFRRPKLGH